MMDVCDEENLNPSTQQDNVHADTQVISTVQVNKRDNGLCNLSSLLFHPMKKLSWTN